MSDLVQRLRQVGAHHWYEHDGAAFCFRCRTFAADWKNRPSTPCQPDALMTEAADEIERLREVAVLREQEVAAVRARAVEYHCSLVAARAEIERLQWWQREVADGMGYLNQAEGQTGYEVAPPVVILAAWQDAGQRIERAEMERDAARAALDGWVKWAASSRCIYCGYEFQHDPHDQAGADETKKAHILVCDKHPVALLRAEIAEAKASCMAFGGALVPNECSLLDNIKMLKGDIDTLQAERDEAVALLHASRNVLDAVIPQVCDDVHHRRQDYHDSTDLCPVLLRAREVLARLDAFLAGGGQ